MLPTCAPPISGMMNYSVLSLLSLWCIQLLVKSAGLGGTKMPQDMTVLWGVCVVGYKGVRLLSTLSSKI
jgi:hypothetical protein